MICIFAEDCEVVAFTGDNPSAVCGLNLTHDHHAVISLGTSDTFLLLLPKEFDFKEVLPFGHIFPHPLLKDRYFLMFCYSNGDACRK